MENNIVVEITESGLFTDAYATPDHRIHFFSGKELGFSYVWKSYNLIKCKINALNIEKMYKQTYPIVEVICKRKNVSKLYEWWWKDWNASKIWDIEIKKTAEKTVTVLKMSSGNVMYVDEDISVFENALNNLSR